ncbi:MAG TPA: 4-hydroxythreonine-4-phosphate dehydrogenase PdxA [Candidatus Margulisbacteria bacterium]|nr:MAG: 4-hydroxythreonine-4-phosphate dehydrogenase PdxA [Candidatus Margulisbacteria bacterium GWD2_39_127]OGI04238.1 MAG: 4-hydroxythreonine-4-phosphate dehydrogenase PdxA [Candidatus Margulisbacteria bacterium GWF2_38_17]HAR62655.1 4-hydroxythreonine-4-phosphate dehydrogenase PdxA [Candidatus Margulisiibacteriota bacterium]
MTQASSKKIIGITMGDGAGIGPEVIVKTFNRADTFKDCIPVVIGDYQVIEKAIDKFLRVPIAVHSVKSIYDISQKPYVLNILDLENLKNSSIVFGQINSETGKASAEYVIKAIELALAGDIDAIVTAPISKYAIQKAGFKYDGHTEILAEKTKTANYAMAFFSEKINVTLVTTHIPLSKVAEQINKNLLFDKIYLAYNALLNLGIKTPKIAVAGLNPHAGESGLFGKEEEESIVPAIKQAQHLGIKISGPFPADTLFTANNLKYYDMFIAMYHDQGLIPVKMLAFDSAVNVTLGLPIIRTSVDHGTAFDIAGKGIANPSSMIEALKLATRFKK